MTHPQKGKRYPMNVITYARRLHEKNGWSAHQIRKALAIHGHTPTHGTVLKWIDEEYAEEVRERNRIAMRRRSGSGPGRPGPRRSRPWDRRLVRMRELRDVVGLSYRDIAALMTLDFEDIELDTEQVRSILQGKVQTKTIRRHLWPKGSRRREEMAI